MAYKIITHENIFLIVADDFYIDYKNGKIIFYKDNVLKSINVAMFDVSDVKYIFNLKDGNYEINKEKDNDN